jgi:hypothetical protein
MAAQQRERRRRASLRAESREARRVKRRFRRRIVRSILIVFGGMGGLAIVLALVLPSSLGQIGGDTASSEAGIQVATQGSEVIEAGEEHLPYNTTPPTSGWYYEIPLENISWGALQEPVENEVQVAYLERGGVMVQYNCPDDCPDLLPQLERVVNTYPQGVILAPYPDTDSTIALTAWGWIDTFEAFDEVRIEQFIQGHLDQGPESLQ